MSAYEAPSTYRRLAVTLGDPAGIGPEVTQAALEALALARPHVDVTVCGPLGMADALALRLQTLGKGVFSAAVTSGVFSGPMGQASAAGGAASLAALDHAMALVERGACDALVTAPISKQALALAGSRDRGHTEILARRLGLGNVAMAFFTPTLRVVLATVHVALKDIWKQLTTQRVVDVAMLLNEAIKRQEALKHKPMAAPPRLALAGLNPHAGEHGLLGDEESTLLMPAVAQAQALGIDLSEPQPPDTVFCRAAAGDFDGVVALYHDQGLIPVKMLSFGDAVNVTLGLKAIRTSPDHGTAYDRVGRGTARHSGMLRALEAALDLG